MTPTPIVQIDAVGLVCPVPIIRLARAARDLGSGIIELVADDPATQPDVPAWCDMRSATLLETSSAQQRGTPVFRYLIQVGAEPLENAGGVPSTASRSDR